MGVLASAVGASFFIISALKFKEESETYSNRTSQVSTGGVQVIDVRIQKTDTTTFFRELVTPSASSRTVDLRQVMISLRIANVEQDFRFGPALDPNAFTVEILRDGDGSFKADDPILNEADLAEIWIDLGAVFELLPPKAELRQTIFTGSDKPMEDTFYLPSTATPGSIVGITSVPPEEEATA